MGNVAANRLTSSGGIDGTALGASGGAQTQTLSTSNMPAHTHSVNITSTSGGAHTHEYNDAYFAESLTNGVGGNARYGTSASTDNDNSFRFRTSTDTHSTTKDNINTSSNGSHTHSVSGNTESTGSGSALSTVNPGLVLNYIIKL
jgi:microcystin-dependent protein